MLYMLQPCMHALGDKSALVTISLAANTPALQAIHQHLLTQVLLVANAFGYR
jgi:putative Ca2+/H+ antiporter (TMEM165/GDT1 family)